MEVSFLFFRQCWEPKQGHGNLLLIPPVLGAGETAIAQAAQAALKGVQTLNGPQQVTAG